MTLSIWYNLDESSGSLVDSVSSANLAIYGSITYRKDGYKSGSYAIALTSGNYASNSRLVSPLPSGSAARSFSFWVKTSSTAGNMTVLSYGAKTTRQAFTISINHDATNNLGIWTWGDDGYFATGTNNITNNVWHHVAITYAADSTQIKVYYDGALLGTKNLGAALSTYSSGSFYVGRSIGDLEGFTGSLDDLRIYDHELTLSDIQILYSEKPFGYGQAQGSVAIFRQQYGQSLAYISNTQFAQANADIWRGELYGQSIAYIIGTYPVLAQSQAVVVLAITTPYFSEIQARSPYAYWSFNQDPTYTNVLDASGNGRHAGIGGTIRLNKPPLVNVNNSYSKAATIYVDEATSGSALWTTASTFQPTVFSVAFWLNPSALGNDYHAILAYNGWNAFVFHSTSSGGVYVGTDIATRMVPGTGAGQIPNGTLAVGQRAFYVFTYNAGSGNFYKNGELIASKAGMTAPVNWGGFYISLNNATSSIRGTVDEVSVFTTELSQESIRLLYLVGLGVGYGQALAKIVIVTQRYGHGLARAYVLGFNVSAIGLAVALITAPVGQAQAFIAYPFYPGPIPPEGIVYIDSTYTVTGFDTTQFPTTYYKEAYMQITLEGTICAAKFETTGSNYDTVLILYDSTWTEIIRDDDSGEGYTSLIDNFNLVSSETYGIGVRSYWRGEGGSLNFQITPYFADHVVRFGAANATIFAYNTQQFGQALAHIIIKDNFGHGQSAAYFIAIGTKAFGQARFYINMGQAAGLAQAWIQPWWGIGQALALIEGLKFGQAEAFIDSPIWPTFLPTGQSLADIWIPYRFGIAQAYIAFAVWGTTFYDSFTRNIPINQIGTPDIGSYSFTDTAISSQTTFTSYNGRLRIAPDPYAARAATPKWADFILGKIEPDYEIYFEFEVEAETTNVSGIYFETPSNYWDWPNIRGLWGEIAYNSGKLTLSAYQGPESVTTYLGYPIENAGVHAARITKFGADVTMTVWLKSEAEPSTPSIAFTLTDPLDINAYGEFWIEPFFYYYSSGIEVIYLDNITIKGTTYNDWPLAHGEAIAKIGIPWHDFGQARAYILPGRGFGFGQALAHILSDSNLYQDFVLSIDTPSIFYGMETIPPNGSSATLYDIMGFANSTIGSFNSPYVSAIPGIAWNGTNFGSIYNYVYTTKSNGSSFLYDNTISIEFWVRITEKSREHGYISGNSSTLYFGICGATSGWGAWAWGTPASGYKPTFSIYSYVNNTNIYEDFQAPDISLNEWHHIVFTTTSKEAKIYVDGELQAEKTWTGVVYFNDTSTTYIYTKRDYSSGATTQYSMDEFALYEYVLPPDNILAHYVFAKTGGFSPYVYGQATAYVVGVPEPGVIRWIWSANAQAKIIPDRAYGQAITFIYHPIGIGQAGFKVLSPPTDGYRSMVVADGATSYWGFNSLDATTYAKALVDEIGTNHIDTTSFYTYEPTPVAYNKWGTRGTGYTSRVIWYIPTFLNIPQWSFELWVRAPLLANYETPIFSFYENGNLGAFDLSFGSNVTRGATGNYIVIWRSATSTIYSSTAQYVPGKWYHIVLVNNNGQFKVYADGAEIISTPEWGWNGPASGYYAYLHYGSGYGYGTSNSTNNMGWYDNAAFYPLILSSTIINNHYLLGAFGGFAFGQAAALLARYSAYGQAQAEIKSHRRLGFGQAAVKLPPSNVFGQAVAWIDVYKGGLKKGLQAIIYTNTSLTTQWTKNPGNPYMEVGPNKPAYTSTAPVSYPPPGIPQSTNWGIRWLSTFVADQTGLWQFQILIDDVSVLTITDVETGQPTIVYNNSYSSSIQGPFGIALKSGKTYSAEWRWYQGSQGGWNVTIWYKRPSDTSWNYLTDNNPPWITYPTNFRDNAYAQATSLVFPRGPNSNYPDLLDNYWRIPRTAQAMAVILGWGFGQALAYIAPFKTGQAIARLNEWETYPKVVLEDNPYFYHRLWDASGTEVSNSAANPFPSGTYVGSPTLNQPSPLTVAGNVLGKSVYLGDNQYITVGPTSKLNNTFTIEAWAKVSNTIQVDTESTTGAAGTAGERYLWYPNQEGGNSGIGVAMGTNVIAVYEHGSSHMPPILVYEADIGTGWRHVVVVIDRSISNTNAVKLYLDGILVRTKDTANRVSVSPTQIGTQYSGTNLWLQGLVAEAAIYPTALSAERILKHYLAGGPLRAYGQAQTTVYAYNVSLIGLAQAQIIIEEKSYRYTALQDKPILYFPMDENSYWNSKNLVRYPTSGTATYSASTYYSGSYLPEYAADGDYNDGWASSGYQAGNTWWKVEWTTPQTIDTVLITNRPNYTMGSGRIIFSDSTSYNVTFPPNARETATYRVSVTNVTWMQVISDSGGNTNPGFSEVEAYFNGPVNLVRYPTNGGTVTFEARSMYDPNYPPDKAADYYNTDGWAASGYSAGLWWKVTWENPQTFQTVRLMSRPGNDWMGYGYIELSDGSIIPNLTFPYSPNHVAVYEVQATNITWMKVVSTSGGVSNPGFADVAVYEQDVGKLHNLIGTEYASIDHPNFGSYDGTVIPTFELETQSRSGTSIDFNGKYSYRPGGFTDIPISTSPNSVVTIEAWLYWDGGDAQFPWGFYSYDVFFAYGGVGFNRGASDLYGVSSSGLANKWIHLAAVMYHNQNYTVANKIYINGIQQTLSQMSGSSGTVSLTKNLVIGGWANNTSGRWTGRIDEFAVYNYELTAEQILNHFRAVTDRQYANTLATIIRQAETPGYLEWTGLGQAQARIITFDYPQLGVARGLISRIGEGLVRMIWTGGAYNISNIQYWGVEETVNQIYYDDGTGPPNYPGSNAGAAWSVRFIADETGSWSFRTVSDDNSEVWIDGIRVVDNTVNGDFTYSGHGDQDRNGSIALTSGIEYNLHVRWGQGGGPYTIHVYYKRPSDPDWILLTNNNPPWMSNIAGSRYRSFGLAKADIEVAKTKWESGQAAAHIKTTYRGFGLALAQRGHFQYGTALAGIYAFNINGFGLALAQISWTRYGQSQAHIYAINVSAYGLAIAKFGREAHGLARARIRATHYGFGQAYFKMEWPKAYGFGLADIYQTYPLMGFDSIWSENAGVTVTTSITPIYGTGANVVDKDEYNTFVIMVPYPGEEPITGEWIKIDLGTTRTVNMWRILPLSDAKIDIEYSTNNQDWYTAVSTIQPDADPGGPFGSGYQPEWTMTGTFDDISARYWRAICGGIVTYDTFAFTTIQLGYATVKGPTFGQALAMIGWNQYGLAQARIVASNQNGLGRALALIYRTYEDVGQAQTWMIPPSQWANAFATIYRTYEASGQTNTYIIPPAGYGNAQATIHAYDVEGIGLARAATRGRYAQIANVKAIIVKPEGYASTKTSIYRWAYGPYGRVSGQALGMVGWQPYQVTGQAYTRIRHTYNDRLIGQANARIYRTEGYGLAKSAMLHFGYQKFGQAFVVWGMNWIMGQARTHIYRTYFAYGSTKAWIYQTSQATGQATVVIRGYSYGQSQAQLVKTFPKIGQARADIDRGHRVGQASARIIAFDVPKTGQANGYIIVSGSVIVTPPTSNFYTYLVRFADSDLAGYAQAEDYDSVMNIQGNYAGYIDGSLSEYLGLVNKNINITMRVWEQTYAECKAKVQLSATSLRKVKGFQRLYIQHRDRYYLALAKRMTVQKSVPQTSRILDYSVEFEAQPWLISNEVYSVSGTGEVPVVRNLSQGGWTPTIVTVSGTDISITGTGMNGQSTGSITLSGTHTDAVIDTEAFTVYENGVSQYEYINKDFSLYVGPGTTTFTITGASSCTIQWQSRWYL